MDVERRYARKVYYNARGVVGLGCNLSPGHYCKTHWQDLCTDKTGGSPATVCFTMVNNDAVC